LSDDESLDDESLDDELLDDGLLDDDFFDGELADFFEGELPDDKLFDGEPPGGESSPASTALAAAIQPGSTSARPIQLDFPMPQPQYGASP
jgi:hypothetical protein